MSSYAPLIWLAGIIFLGLTRFTHQLGRHWGKRYYLLSAFIRPTGMLLIVTGWLSISSSAPGFSYFDMDWDLILSTMGWSKRFGPGMQFWLYCFGIAGMLASLGFGLWAILTLGLRHSFLYRRYEDSLIVHGPYGIVRHPQFLSAIGITFFSPILSMTSIIFLNVFLNWIFFTLALWILAVIEDKELALHYGEEYIKYSSLVPRLFPN